MKQANLVICLLLACGAADALAADVTMSDIAALHWHPETAEQARRHTLALSAWLSSDTGDLKQWRQRVDAGVVRLERLAERVDPAHAPAADGQFARLVHASEHGWSSTPLVPIMPSIDRASEAMRSDERAGRAARLYGPAALAAPRLWRALDERLAAQSRPEEAEEADGVPSLDALWRPLLERAAADDPPSDRDVYARSQAERVVAMETLDAPAERARIIAELLAEQATFEWSRGRVLRSIWAWFEGLMHLTANAPTAELSADYQRQLERLLEDNGRELRRVETDLPVIVALLSDAASRLDDPEGGVLAATAELADVYARLALFISDADFYLEQPVREDLRAAIARCNRDSRLVGPLPREVYDECLNRLTGLIINGLDRQELSGGSGPFAPEFLGREMNLVSWQRASYLDGHVNWLLQANCEAPRWINVLEWSMLLHYLALWVPQRQVFFGSERWQDATEAIMRVDAGHRRAHTDWLDCVAGTGSVRMDPVSRLLERQAQAHDVLAQRLTDAAREFYAEVTRPGADIDLDAGAKQVTTYRPEGLAVKPCADRPTCGARAELPASRALLGLFPNAHLLADQLDMGRLELCYGNVRWVERETRPARSGDVQVAHYHGRLRFELVGSFRAEGEDSVVFRHQLTAAEPRHYLFAALDASLLERDCPVEMAGSPIASRLRDEGFGLVPNRLTYFASTPTTPEAELLANWDTGAEWRDWFVTGNRVESLDQRNGEALAAAVGAMLDQRVEQRERRLTSSMLAPFAGAAEDAVGEAMFDVSQYSALLRRVLEIHYPRILRHDDRLRSLASGDGGVLTRERVRRMRDDGVSAVSIPVLGRERLERLRDYWQGLPVALREFGQHAPELDFGAELLDRLIQLGRSAPAGDDGAPTAPAANAIEGPDRASAARSGVVDQRQRAFRVPLSSRASSGVVESRAAR
jgi:hypothetical protein